MWGGGPLVNRPRTQTLPNVLSIANATALQVKSACTHCGTCVYCYQNNSNQAWGAMAMGVRRIPTAGWAVGLCGQDAGALKRWGLIVLDT